MITPGDVEMQDVPPQINRDTHDFVDSFSPANYDKFRSARSCLPRIYFLGCQLANRVSENTIPLDRIPEIERRVGEAVLRTITANSL